MFGVQVILCLLCVFLKVYRFHSNGFETIKRRHGGACFLFNPKKRKKNTFLFLSRVRSNDGREGRMGVGKKIDAR